MRSDAAHTSPDASANPLAGLTVLQRGWLSSNNVLIHGAPGEAGAVVVGDGGLVLEADFHRNP